MRRLSVRWHLLPLVFLGFCLAWTNRQPQNYSLHRYAIKNMSQDRTRYYVSMDLTMSGYIKGLDYFCYYAYAACTLAADPFLAHVDGTGTWFYVSDVPSSGIDMTGFYAPADF